MATSTHTKDSNKVPDTTDVAVGTSHVYDAGPTEEIDEAYLRASKFTKFYRGVLFQMILFGALSFVGPAMSDAISNLGGGGLSTPYLANLATALAYMSGCLLTIFGGPLINKFGIQWSCMIAAVAMPLAGSAYYVSAKYHVDWYLLLARLIGGFANGFLRVRRKNGAKVPTSGKISWKGELIALWRHMQRKKTWLVSIPAFYSFFCGGTMGTYLSLHFSVRARALSSLLVPSLTIVMVLAYGKLLDRARWSQAKRAWISFILWAIPQAAAFIWIGIEYSKFGSGKSKNALDYELHTARWAEAYLPYLIMFTTTYWCQLSLYWILSTFSTDVGSSSRSGGLFRAFETAGQAVSYAINSKTGADPRIPFYVNAVLLVISAPCMVFLIRLVPDVPAITDVDAGDVANGGDELDPDRK
ncbi:putative major facilitator superfamily transporter [Colletotrichum sublineola]|uniref:Putative major facilitator superfamily transporter n=1 Tax=Colletotrichum sublineola TaxID=1173701 RepID=A0A066WZH6_COLSU|nr:putative major facilitator superfamily transporter [Colletotrichum sublineola]